MNDEREHLAGTENLTCVRLWIGAWKIYWVGRVEAFPKLAEAMKVYLGNHKQKVTKCAKALKNSAEQTSRVIEARAAYVKFTPTMSSR